MERVDSFAYQKLIINTWGFLYLEFGFSFW